MRLPDELLPEEMDIMRRVSGLPVDFEAIAVLANIWRAAQAFQLRMERTVLREFELTWAGFSTLFILWIWVRLKPARLPGRKTSPGRL